MNLLTIDTSTSACSVALTSGERLVAECLVNQEKQSASRLLECVDTVLRMSGFTVADLDGFGVALGPGSFTGVRIGIATVKGLALAARKRVAGFSSLAMLAMNLPWAACPVCPMFDARKNEVVVIRQNPAGKPLVTVVNMEEVQRGIDMTNDINLMPYDMVFVPKSPIGEVDDVPAPLVSNVRCKGLAQKERRFEIDGKMLVPVDLGRRGPVARLKDRRVVDQDVYMTEAINCALDYSGRRSSLTQIGLYGNGITSHAHNSSDGLLSRIGRRAVMDRQPHAVSS